MSERIYTIVPIPKKSAILSMLKRGERVDGRRLDEYREIRIETGVVTSAEGSARVFLGHTKVIAGVKSALGAPFPDTPNEGVQIVNAELIPMASPIFEPGPPDENDVELARVVDRGLRSAGTIDLKNLALAPGKTVWRIFIDIYPLDHDGNLIDASGLAAVAALATAKLPKAELSPTGNVVLSDERIPLPIQKLPVFVTFAKIDDVLIVDPCYEEELVMDARITFSLDEEGKIYAIQKGRSGGFKPEEIKHAIEVAVGLASELKGKLASAIKV